MSKSNQCSLEIADHLSRGEYDWCPEAETRLREQYDRIKVLEANHKIQLDINEKALQYIEQLEQGLRASIELNKAQADRQEK